MTEQSSSTIVSLVVYIGDQDSRQPPNICAFLSIFQPPLQLFVAIWMLLASKKIWEITSTKVVNDWSGSFITQFYWNSLEDHRLQMA